MTYNVTIEETISRAFRVDADSLEDAIEVARKGYKDGKIVVENGVCSCVQAMADDGEYCTEWTEI